MLLYFQLISLFVVREMLLARPYPTLSTQQMAANQPIILATQGMTKDFWYSSSYMSATS